MHSRYIKKRKGDWLGHIIRGIGILTTVLQGTMKEERIRETKRLKLTNLDKRREYIKK